MSRNWKNAAALALTCILAMEQISWAQQDAVEVSARLPTTRATRSAVAAMKEVRNAESEMLATLASLEKAFAPGTKPGPERAKLWSQLEYRLGQLEAKSQTNTGVMTNLSKVMIQAGAEGTEQALAAVARSQAQLRATTRPIKEQRQTLARLRQAMGIQLDSELETEFRSMSEADRLLQQMEPALVKARDSAARTDVEARKAAAEISAMAAASSVYTAMVTAAKGLAHSRALREEGVSAKCAMAAAMGSDPCRGNGGVDLRKLVREMNSPATFQRILGVGEDEVSKAAEEAEAADAGELPAGDEAIAWRAL